MAESGPLTAQEQALLEARAQRYARRDRGLDLITFEVVRFSRGRGAYAVAVGELKEIRPLRSLCRVPGARAVVPGVVACRGEILSAHDLEAFLTGAAPEQEPSWLIVVEDDDRRLALLADEVSDVVSVSATSRQPLPVTLGERAACFQALLDGEALLVDVASLFSHRRFFEAF